MQLPSFADIERDECQLDVYETPPDESLFVVGPPGSGKTVLVIARAHLVTNKPVVIVTYNRMLQHLLETLVENANVTVYTMHKFVWDQFSNQTGKSAPNEKDAAYSYDWDAMFSILIEQRVTSEDIHLIVDEGQDLPKMFYYYIRKFVARTITVFADEYQAVGDRYTSLNEIKFAAGLENPIVLRYNHRNSPEIARVAHHFHTGSAPVPETIREAGGEVPVLMARTKMQTVELIANWYQTRGQRVGVAVVSNRTGSYLLERLRELVHSHDVWMYSRKEKNEHTVSFDRPGITILNVESIKGQEFDTVFVVQVEKLLAQLNELNKRKMYMLCSRAKDHLFLICNGQSIPQATLNNIPMEYMSIRS